MMRNIGNIFRLSLPVLLMAMTSTALAAEDVSARAMKLYEKHYYEDAARLLRPQLAGMDSASQAAARLTLGMIYLRSAELYRELQRGAELIETDYLKQLAAEKGENSSRYVNFYLGLALIEDGKLAEGTGRLQRFSASAGVAADYKSYAKVELGLAYWKQKQTQKANAIWAGVPSGAEGKAALAAAYAAAGEQGRNPQAMADAAMAEAKKRGNNGDARLARNLLRAYAHAAAPEKALDLLATNEFRGASYIESPGKSKTLNFYDPGLLGDIALAHLHAAVMYLEQAAHDAKLGNTAAYFLTDAYLLLGNAELSQRQAAIFLAQPQTPVQYREHALSRRAAAQYLAGKRQEANVIWMGMAEQSGTRPDALAEVMSSCTLVQADCVNYEHRAAQLTEAGEGKKYFQLNAALGKYYLSRKDYPKAALYIEAGRDKANKNKIEVNDPAMLATLAQAYYYNKKFSESLEIYFEMSKQYPAVRQIQDAMQGIYAVEQKSAGDVKIF